MLSSQMKVAAGSALAIALLLSASYRLHAADNDEAFIVECIRPCDAIRSAVGLAGGTVTYQFENVDAIAVRVPRNGVAALVSVAGASSVHKDVEVASPPPVQAVEASGQVADALDAATLGDIQPENYNFNLGITNVAPLHAVGERGQDVIVALIDTGTANVSTLPELGSSVIGGETFVPATQDSLPATHHENAWHGTTTADMIAAHGVFLFTTASALVQAINHYAPGSAIPCSTIPGTCGLTSAVAATASAVPMTGTAPGARIYAMKVFPASGGGAPESRIIAAMDRAVTLRRNYNQTGANAVASGTGTETNPFVYSALKIDVVNMSLGGLTLFPGGELQDRLTLALLDAGITVMTAAGNNGPSAITVESPGTGFGSLTVAAASTAVHERILRDLQFGPGAGAVYRPTTHIQTAYFSSRGPDADGRIDPDLSANGVGSYVRAYAALRSDGALLDCRATGAVAGTCQPRILFVAGTSFATPTVAGAVAVLRRAHPAATATQIRNALQQSANPLLLGDDSTRIDQGNGFVDVAAAAELLASGAVSDTLPDIRPNGTDPADALGSGGSSVTSNVRRAGFDIAQLTADGYSTWVRDLRPGQVRQIFLPSDARTSSFTITVDHVTPALPPGQQNQFFLCGPQNMPYLCGDDVLATIVDAPTSIDLTRAQAFVNTREPLVANVSNPQTGLVRIAVMGDWTNAGTVSALVTVTRQQRPNGPPTDTANIEQDEIRYVDIDVPAGVSKAVFELQWLQNWGRFPTTDLDLVLFDPAGRVNAAGASLNSPERVEITNPAAGRWKAAIVGFTIHGNRGHGLVSDGDGPQKDVYTFTAQADGKRLKEAR